MKKFLYLMLLLISGFARANEEYNWQNIYAQIRDAYIGEIKTDKLAVAALKGINNLDKNLKIADDNTRITLYYKGKVVKVLRKADEDDNKKWGDISEEFIEAARRVSPRAEEKSFLIVDEMAKGILNILDVDSEFYANMDEARGINGRNKRYFTARMEDDETLYVKINAFNKQTYNELEKALDINNTAKKLILDVRGCPGGMAGEAIKIADLFLDEGIIASTRSKDELSQIYYNADEQEKFSGKDMEIWIDNNTASAAEILAAALQEQGRAVIKGQRSYGKGTMQQLILLPSKSVLAVTSGYFQTPSGRDLNKSGVVPDKEEEDLPW